MAHPAPSRGERAAAPASQHARESEAVRTWPGLPRPSPKPGPPIRSAPGMPSAPRQKHPNPCQRSSAFDEPIGLAKPPEARATSTNHELRTTNQPSSRKPTKSNKPLPTPRYNNAMLILILALWLETHSPTSLAAVSAAEHSVLDAVGTNEKTIDALPATSSQHLEIRATWQKTAIHPTPPIEPGSASETPWPNTRKTHQTNAQSPKPALRGPPPQESTQTNETPGVYARFELDSPVAPNKLATLAAEGGQTAAQQALRPDVLLSGGRSGQLVKSLVGPPSSVVRGGGARAFVTNEQGQVILDITAQRVKPVIPGQGFGPKRPPTAEELDLLGKIFGGGQ
jgi:hypothetical protein